MKTDATPWPGPDWSRRDFLGTAFLGGASAMAPTVFRPSAADWAAHPAFGRARSCLLIFLAGGPSHLDTFDPKPDAPA